MGQRRQGWGREVGNIQVTLPGPSLMASTLTRVSPTAPNSSCNLVISLLRSGLRVALPKGPGDSAHGLRFWTLLLYSCPCPQGCSKSNCDTKAGRQRSFWGRRGPRAGLLISWHVLTGTRTLHGLVEGLATQVHHMEQ